MSTYEENRRKLNSSRFRDPERWNKQLETGKQFITETAKELTKPENIQEMLVDMAIDSSIFLKSDNPYSAFRTILARRGTKFILNKADIPTKVAKNYNDLNRLTQVGEEITRKTGIDNVARNSGVVQFLDSTNLDGIFTGPTSDVVNSFKKQTTSILEKYPVTAQNIGTDLPSYITPSAAKARNKAMKAAGKTSYIDEFGHVWKLEGTKVKQWRNTNVRKATKKTVNPFTEEVGSRLGSTRASTEKRLRDLVPSSAEEAKHISAMRKEIAKMNKDLGLKKGNPDFMTLEHRVAQKDWKRLDLPGNPADSPNLWITKEYEAITKTSIENSLRAKTKDYIVNFNPQNNSLNITKLEEFNLHEIPKGKRFKKNKKGLYNWDEINKYLKTLE